MCNQDREGSVQGDHWSISLPEAASRLGVTLEELHDLVVSGAKAAARERIEELTFQVRTEGKSPAGEHTPEGEVLLSTRTLHGTGTWWVVGPAHIWYVRNSGRDNDTWGANNVVTGGAGAIGWRVPTTTALAEELHRLASLLR